MKLVKQSKTTDYSIWFDEENEEYYLFEGEDVLTTPMGNEVYTSFKPIV